MRGIVNIKEIPPEEDGSYLTPEENLLVTVTSQSFIPRAGKYQLVNTSLLCVTLLILAHNGYMRNTRFN